MDQAINYMSHMQQRNTSLMIESLVMRKFQFAQTLALRYPFTKAMMKNSITSRIDIDLQGDHKNLGEKPKIIVKMEDIVTPKKPTSKIKRIKTRTKQVAKKLKINTNDEGNKREL